MLGRLREAEPWPAIDAIAITHFHLDHWGDLVPVGLGQLLPARATTTGGRSSGSTGAAAPSSRSSARGSASPTCSSGRSSSAEYDAETPFTTAAGLDVLPVRLPHYRLETYGFRVTNGAATLAYTGDTGPSERIADLARDADLFVCEATLEHGDADGEPRGHLSAEEALEAYAASGARTPAPHPPPVGAAAPRRRRARLRRDGARGRARPPLTLATAVETTAA